MKIIQLQGSNTLEHNGKYTVVERRKYNPGKVFNTLEEAKTQLLWDKAYKALDAFNKAQDALEKAGLIDENDPRGWTA